ncbi:hypothetical protein T05_3829 [Trichinella murrelli]|uniref:Uncharacterized protein n=1 Tax=Trichinella murrelli TaxID=144512 RepID=A0A0V0T0F0_9BILA|nr:hypothetical protein T05_3307 [Trichinella murrelli]KRX32677.1 hypothetical protein T05_3829 [Trichinella murrelli]
MVHHLRIQISDTEDVDSWTSHCVLSIFRRVYLLVTFVRKNIHFTYFTGSCKLTSFNVSVEEEK